MTLARALTVRSSIASEPPTRHMRRRIRAGLGRPRRLTRSVLGASTVGAPSARFGGHDRVLALDVVRPGSAAGRLPGRGARTFGRTTLSLLRAVRDAAPGARAHRAPGRVEVDLAVGDAAGFRELQEAAQHRARDQEVGGQELGPLVHAGEAAVGPWHRVSITGRLADLRVDLGEVAVDRPAAPVADELDVAVRLVVAAADERRVLEGREVPVDERPRRVVVDREQDEVPLQDEVPDVGERSSRTSRGGN